MNKQDRLELAHEIIDIFEGYLDDKGIVIPNREKEETKDDYDKELQQTNIFGEDIDLIQANIFGEEYYRLEDEIVEILKKSGV